MFNDLPRTAKDCPKEALLYNEGKLWNKIHQYLAVSSLVNRSSIDGPSC